MNYALETWPAWDGLIEMHPVTLLLSKITLLLILAWGAHGALVRANPRWRVLLWRMTASSLLALPILAIVLPAIRLEVARKSEDVVYVGVARQGAREFSTLPDVMLARPNPRAQPVVISVGDSEISSHVTTPPLPSPARRIPIAWIIVVVWLAGILFRSVRFAIVQRRIAELIRTALPVPSVILDLAVRVGNELGIRSTPRVLFSDRTQAPMLAGVFNPVILLPARMGDPSYQNDLPGILAHELAHLRARDLPWFYTMEAVASFLWLHPLTWWISRVHSAACERVSDAISASYVGDANAYSRTLARVAIEIATATPASGAISMARGAKITQRLDALRRRVFANPLNRRGVAVALLAGLVLVGLVGGLHLVYAEKEISAKPASDKGFVEGIVLAPDGTPAVRAELSVSAEDTQVIYINARPDSTHGFSYSDEGGRFQLPARQGRFGVTVVHEKGFAAVSSKDLVPPQEIRLKEWAHIEGKAFVGAKPAAGVKVSLFFGVQPRVSGYIYYPAYQTITADDGSFAFDKVMPLGQTYISREASALPNNFARCTTPLLMEPGTSETIQIGGKGRPVTGRIVRAEDRSEFDFVWGIVIIENIPASLEAVRTRPDDASKPRVDGRRQLLKVSPEDWRELRRYTARFDEDGRFRLEDVEPGKYRVRVELPKGLPDQASSERTRASCKREIEVGEIVGGRSDEPLDVGDLNMALDKQSKVSSAGADDNNGLSGIVLLPDGKRAANAGIVVAEGKKSEPVDLGKFALGATAPQGAVEKNPQITLLVQDDPGEAWWKLRPDVYIVSMEEGAPYHQNYRFEENRQLSFDLPPPGKYRVGIAPKPEAPFFPPLDIEIKDRKPVTLIFKKGPSLVGGRVVGRLPNARNEFVTWSRGGYAPGGRCKVDQDGRYILESLTAERHRLCYRGDNIMPNYFTVELKEGENNFDIQLPKCRLEGRIIGASYERRNGSPLGEIQVIPRGSTVMSGNHVAFVDADENGKFVVDHLWPGNYVVRWKQIYVAKPKIAEGQTTVSVELKSPGKLGSISGDFQCAADLKPTEQKCLWVRLLPKDNLGYDITAWYACQVTQAPLHYQIEEVPEGTYGLFVAANGQQEVPYLLIPDIQITSDVPKTFDFKIPPGRPVQIVCGIKSSRIESCRWNLIYPGGGKLMDQPFAALQRMFQLPLGDYKLEVLVSNLPPFEQAFSVTEGVEPLVVKLNLPAIKGQQTDEAHDSGEIKRQQLEANASPPLNADPEKTAPVSSARTGGSKGPSGIVLSPDGKPASGAELSLIGGDPDWPELAGRKFQTSYTNGVNGNAGNFGVYTAGPDGRFQLPPVPGAYAVALKHDAGFLLINRDDLEKNSEIRLREYATVKGKIFRGDKPIAGERLVLECNFPPLNNNLLPGVYSLSSSDKDGSFAFFKVPPIEGAVVSREVALAHNSFTFSHGVPIELKSGQITNVRIGGSGRTVVGRVTAKGRGLDLSWGSVAIALPTQTNWQGPYYYTCRVQSDGFFKIDDVPPGKYGLRISITGKPHVDPEGFISFLGPPDLGTVEGEIEVPAAAEGKELEPVNLGEFSLEATAPQAGVEKPAQIKTPSNGEELQETKKAPSKGSLVAKMSREELEKGAHEFEALYAMPEGEVFRWIRPPFPECRLMYYRYYNEYQAEAIPEGPDNMLFRWEGGKLQRSGMSFSWNGAETIPELAEGLLKIQSQECEGDRLALRRTFKGDFIVRSDAPVEKVIARMQEVLSDGYTLKLELKEVERPVYVARGSFSFTPIPGRNDEIELYGTKLNNDPRSGGGGSDQNIDAFLKALGYWIKWRVVNDIGSPPSQTMSWHYNSELDFDTQARKDARNPDLVLKNVTDQTGLTFSIETRKVRALIVQHPD